MLDPSLNRGADWAPSDPTRPFLFSSASRASRHAVISRLAPRSALAMSRQRKRHLDRQPVEEAVRAAVSELVGDGGSVEVERCSYDWREDDLFVRVRLNSLVGGAVLELFRQRLAKEMNNLLPAGRRLEDWMLVAEYGGKAVFTISWHERV